MQKRFLVLLLSSIVLFSGFDARSEFALFLKGFKTKTLPYSRDVYVYLPSEYMSSPNKKYPVLYMQDGQNLFDLQRSAVGKIWNAETTLDQLIAQKLMAPIILVAIDNTRIRTDEYTYDRDPSEAAGGKADDYMDLILQDLKPKIDQSFRTEASRNSTGILGSSLGGLVSLYAGLEFSSTFGLVGALSPSIWWNRSSIVNRVMNSKRLPLKVYLDSGDIGGEKPGDVLRLSDALKRRGFTMGKNLRTVIQKNAAHDETFWAQRFPIALQFLFPYPSRTLR